MKKFLILSVLALGIMLQFRLWRIMAAVITAAVMGIIMETSGVHRVIDKLYHRIFFACVLVCITEP